MPSVRRVVETPEGKPQDHIRRRFTVREGDCQDHVKSFLLTPQAVRMRKGKGALSRQGEEREQSQEA